MPFLQWRILQPNRGVQIVAKLQLWSVSRCLAATCAKYRNSDRILYIVNVGKHKTKYMILNGQNTMIKDKNTATENEPKETQV